MSIYSNDNIRKIAKLTTRELPQKSKNAEITVRENNGLYSTCALLLKMTMSVSTFCKFCELDKSVIAKQCKCIAAEIVTSYMYASGS